MTVKYKCSVCGHVWDQDDPTIEESETGETEWRGEPIEGICSDACYQKSPESRINYSPTPMIKVYMESMEYGREEFEYETMPLALAAIERLTLKAAEDKVRREIGIVVNDYAPDFAT